MWVINILLGLILFAILDNQVNNRPGSNAGNGIAIVGIIYFMLRMNGWL